MRLISSLAAAILIAASACDSRSVPEPEGLPTISGTIVARDIATSIGGAPTMHVKETPTASCGIIFTIRDSTRIFRRASADKLVEVPASDLVVGTSVRVWSGVVLESCPAQSSAGLIEIV